MAPLFVGRGKWAWSGAEQTAERLRTGGRKTFRHLRLPPVVDRLTPDGREDLPEGPLVLALFLVPVGRAPVETSAWLYCID